jgi:hypothetical protein
MAGRMATQSARCIALIAEIWQVARWGGAERTGLLLRAWREGLRIKVESIAPARAANVWRPSVLQMLVDLDRVLPHGIYTLLQIIQTLPHTLQMLPHTLQMRKNMRQLRVNIRQLRKKVAELLMNVRQLPKKIAQLRKYVCQLRINLRQLQKHIRQLLAKLCPQKKLFPLRMDAVQTLLHLF